VNRGWVRGVGQVAKRKIRPSNCRAAMTKWPCGWWWVGGGGTAAIDVVSSYLIKGVNDNVILVSDSYLLTFPVFPSVPVPTYPICFT
jgi:hypothetical protein